MIINHRLNSVVKCKRDSKDSNHLRIELVMSTFFGSRRRPLCDTQFVAKNAVRNKGLISDFMVRFCFCN